ncbi:MAG: hypothetical protein AB7P00_34345 [Sandaracinaceae bacterium]
MRRGLGGCTWASLALVLLSACDGGPPLDDPDAGGVAGPSGSRLFFDAAMLTTRPDAGDLPPDAGTGRDAGPFRDAGPPPHFDAGPRDRECAGIATSCSSLGSSTCLLQLGCRRDGDCTGSAYFCSSYHSSFSCSSQDGCYWLSGSDRCSGFASSCSSYTFSSGCNLQDGCRWTDRCAGVALSCATISVENCLSQSGCYLR